VNRSTPPKGDELEVSIIGPGLGECVILHLGDNAWCVVDSCRARNGNESVAVEYLSNFNNDALGGVRLIVATHWHDDHIQGLTSLLRQAPNAQFGCSTALRSEEFATLVEAAAESTQGKSGVDEFGSILNLLIERRDPKRPKGLVSPVLAIENRKLLHLAKPGRSFSASITALSPSDGSVRLALAEIGKLIPKENTPQRRVINRSPNHASVVLWVEAGSRRILLGADLEHTRRIGDGWVAVVNSSTGPNRATMFKVPHHGSDNADCPEVWEKMLVPDPIAVVTPFNTGGAPLPKPTDMERLRSRTSNLYCTSRGPGKPPQRDQLVEKTARRIVGERRVLEGQPGHVRLRWSVNDETSSPIVEVFNGAYRHE
jgi:hypothetical protein